MIRWLQLSAETRPKLFHPATIHAKVPVADPRSRPEMDEFRLVVENEFHIVDEAQKQARTFIMEIRVVLFYQCRAWQVRNSSL